MSVDVEILKRPICIVDTDADGKMFVHDEVLQQLMSLDRDVVVVAIAGRYRTGKSYLMNRLAEKNQGFPLGSAVEAKTKGIWLWVREHPIRSDQYLVLLDTEGLGDVKKGNANNDNQLLCLAILLSSTFVYNALGVLTDDALRSLHFVTELSKHIQIRSSEHRSSDDNFDLYFPDFVCVLRDFCLDLVLEGQGEVTANQYLEHCLTMADGFGPDVENFNKIRRCIRSYFKKRHCFTLVTPKAGRMRNLDTVCDDELDPEFVQEASNFVKLIYRESPVKTIHGRRLTGKTFGSLLQVYVEQMKTGVPQVENAVDTMAKLENSRAVREAVDLYKETTCQLITLPVLDDEDLSRIHNEALKKAIDFFFSRAVFDDDQVYQEQMNDEIQELYKDLIRRNEETCRNKCLEALNKHYESIVKKMRTGIYTKSGGFREYKDDIELFDQSYHTELGALAVKMNHVFLEFLYSKKAEEDAILRADEKVTAAERAQEAERQKTLEMERQKQEVERAAELQRQMADDQIRAQEENLKRLEEQHAKQRAEDRLHNEQLIMHRMAEQKRLLEEGFKKHAEVMQQKIDALANQRVHVIKRRCSVM